MSLQNTAALTTLFKEHTIKANVIKEENEKKRKQVISSINNVSSALLDSVNNEVSAIFNNQKKLEGEAKALQVATQKFSKQTTQWLTLVENFNNSLKELGDIENWAKTIEKDMRAVVVALDYVNKSQSS